MYLFQNSAIKKKRNTKRLTLKKLSELTKIVDPDGKGISIMTCNRLESKGYDPSIRTVILVCEVLNLNPTRLFRSQSREK